MTGKARFLAAQDGSIALKCPVCGEPVSFMSSGWQCVGAVTHCFPEVDGVPVLLNEQRSIFRVEDFQPHARTTFKNPPRWALALGRLLPSPSRDVSRQRCLRMLHRLMSARPPARRRVLVVGCGDGSVDYGCLGEVSDSLWLETDVSLAGRARVVCDASDLPFQDGSFDLVLCTAVLEHVLEPQRCVDEMHRVLCEDGLVCATTPFMQQVHMGEFDFFRFTRSGHRWIFRSFKEVESGMATGPASVLVWSVEYFLLSWTGNLHLRRIVKGLTRVLLGWLTWLDPILAQRSAALDGAGGYYFVGAKHMGPALAAREMHAYYRGADRVK